MKIAFTGASSTGKTTLAEALMRDEYFHRYVQSFITTDADSLIKRLGFNSIDQMNTEELREFRIAYFKEKQLLENGKEGFLTDRSFVDVAAYWVLCDNREYPKKWSVLTDPCQRLSHSYDIHFYFPSGIIPLFLGGRRSVNKHLHEQTSKKIYQFLVEWGLYFIEIRSAELADRIDQVIKWMKSEKGCR